MAAIEDTPKFETLDNSTAAGGDYLIIWDVDTGKPKKITLTELDTWLAANP